MTAIKIEGAGYPIKDIFNDRFSFNIPNYQRPYAWKIEQTEKLLDDIIDAISEIPNTIHISDISPYFLGNIVLIKPENTIETEVVDGQQRLTTLTIFLAILRELRQSDNLTKYICQPEDEDAGISARPRLYLRERDRDFFKKYIQNLDGTKLIKQIDISVLNDSQKNIIRNANYLYNRINNEFTNKSQKLRLTQFILQRCYLVAVSTPDFESAYRIFSVLNDRGLDLSITDILKADIIGNISKKSFSCIQEFKNLENKYTRKWEDIEESLSRETFSELFSHIRMIYCKSKLKQKTIEEFRKYVMPQVPDPCHLIDKVIEPLADALYDIKNCAYKNDSNYQEINQLFRWLLRNEHSEWIPPAILFLQKFRYHPDKLIDFFQNLERLSAGLMILRDTVHHRIKRYGKIIKHIEQDLDLLQDNSPLQLTKEEKETIITYLDYNNFYYEDKINKYVLLRLDTSISEGIPNYDSYKKITIEHVLPQNPKTNSQWIKWFPTKLEREKYVHCLGNLVLLSRRKNSSAKNYDFNEKKEKYFNAPTTNFSLTIQVINQQEWTPEVIANRQLELINKLKEIWRLS